MGDYEFNLTLAIILVIIGLLAVASLVVGVSYVILAYRLTLRMRKTVGQMEAVLAQSLQSVRELGKADGDWQTVPPMRIKVRRFHSDTISEPLIAKIDAWLLEHSFRYLGQYEIAHDRERLRVYLSDDGLLLSAIRQEPQTVGCYVEFCVDLGHGQRGGVSNPPVATVGLSADAVGRYFVGQLDQDFGLLSQMWLEAKDIVDQHEVLKIDAERIAEFFEQAHAAEMDWRIAQGGVSETEIRTAFAAQGITGTPQDIEAIQLKWQAAIDRYILEFSRRITQLAPVPARVLVVHDSSSALHLLQQFGLLLPIETASTVLEAPRSAGEDSQPAIMELREMLHRFSPREAIARLRPLLPPGLRYQLVESLTQPVEADVYTFPEPVGQVANLPTPTASL